MLSDCQNPNKFYHAILVTALRWRGKIILTVSKVGAVWRIDTVCSYVQFCFLLCCYHTTPRSSTRQELIAAECRDYCTVTELEAR